MSRLLLVETLKKIYCLKRNADDLYIVSKMVFKQKSSPKKNFIKISHYFFRDPENGQKLFDACFEKKNLIFKSKMFVCENSA